MLSEVEIDDGPEQYHGRVALEADGSTDNPRLFWGAEAGELVITDGEVDWRFQDVRLLAGGSLERVHEMHAEHRRRVQAVNQHERLRAEAKERAARRGVVKEAANYTSAVANWIKAGRPTRTDEEVERIHREQCLGGEGPECENYQAGKCLGCGCQVNEGKTALFNKIRMATENCPEGKW